MLDGKRAYICSPLSAITKEVRQQNMEKAKFYLMQIKRLYHCRTFASHAHLTLECLHEAYQMEGDLIKSGKNIYATMIYPFIRMIKEQCSTMELCEEELHKELWRTYETEEDNVKFVDAAWRFLESRQREAV